MKCIEFEGDGEKKLEAALLFGLCSLSFALYVWATWMTFIPFFMSALSNGTNMNSSNVRFPILT